MNVITAALHANHLTGICLSASSLGYDTGLVLKGIDTLSESLTGNEELVVESLYDGLSRGVWRPLDNSGMNTNKIRLSYEAYNRNDPRKFWGQFSSCGIC